MPSVQDLSMGWLHCEPEELFVPKLFGTTDLTTYVPKTIAWLCYPLTAILQGLADQFNIGNLSEFTFIARPIQVCTPSNKFQKGDLQDVSKCKARIVSSGEWQSRCLHPSPCSSLD